MSFFKFILLVGLIALGGNAALADGDSPLALRNALYSVPVPVGLAGQAVLDVPIGNVEVSESRSGLRVRYRLPAELVGPDTEFIQLSQTIQESTLPLHAMSGQQKSPQGEMFNIADASCGRNAHNEKKLMCMIVYHSLQINSDRTLQYLNTQFHGSPDLASRLLVAKAFANEPSGILLIELE